MFSMARFPVLTLFFSLLQDCLILVFNLFSMCPNIIHHISDLLIIQIQPMLNQLWRPTCFDIVHHLIQCYTCTSYRKASVCSNNRILRVHLTFRTPLEAIDGFSQEHF